jgi:hypothetical protein
MFLNETIFIVSSGSVEYLSFFLFRTPFEDQYGGASPAVSGRAPLGKLSFPSLASDR